ncbi:hypothetical protein [Aliikangiella sp. G2MR2-5]|uniref:hypothetical protein n=1 Tax=Aliikangiella sp. G2MR2-5 TaxID=2788943 RepID=UPI0018A95818|nr:hypothetical protein [Aliikangiella sp. G2MR2-5]
MSFENSEILEKSPLAIAVCDKSERVLWCNNLFYEQMHLSSDEVIDKLYPALPIEAINKDASRVQLFSDKANEETRFHYWQALLDKPEGARVHYFAKEKVTNKRFSIATSKLDQGELPKRSNWVEFLNYEVSRSRRYENPLSILKLHLVVFNKPETVAEDTLHETIKDTLMDELRWADMVGHTDHGTYLMILPETPADALCVLEEKLKNSLKARIDFIGSDIQYQLVFGHAHWVKHDDSQRLLQRARADLVEKLEKLLSDSKKPG